MGIKAGIIGAAGFTGAELLRLLVQHPGFEVQVITSDTLKGTPLSEANRTFDKVSDLIFTDHEDDAILGCEAVFLAVPHTAAQKHAPRLLEAGVSVFDLSADYRLKNKAAYELWYGCEHCSPDLLGRAAYGLPEIAFDEIMRVRGERLSGRPALVGCAGCYPTASILAAYPAVAQGYVKPPLIIDAISGVTGAGKAATMKTHFCFANENLEAYGVGKHRHLPEIEQALGLGGQVVFTPHLAPLNRGLLATVYLHAADAGQAMDLEMIHRRYADFYEARPFVSVLPLGDLPKTSSVVGSNHVHIGLAQNEATGTLVAVAAIDNLCKGAAGQAVQCANLVFGFDETCGLENPALYV